MTGRALALALLLAAPAAAQDACPWGGAVAKVQKLPQAITFGASADPDIVGFVEEFPGCEVTIPAVRAAARLPACAPYADRPDALGMEMVFHCLLEKTAGDPPAGTHVNISAIALQRLLKEQ